MLLIKKIKASALQMVLVVSVIIIILLFAFISLLYFQQKMELKHANYSESIYENQQVFEYVKTAKNPAKNIQLFSTKTNSSITQKQWGIFNLLQVNTKTTKEEFKQIALIGNSIPKRKALYLKDKNQQLILVGNTTIKGDAALPKRGVNSGNIAGNTYRKDQFIYGSIEQSNSQLPTITNQQNIRSFLKTYTNDSIAYFDIDEARTLKNSFAKKTLVHQRNGTIDIVNINLIGNIIIESDALIRVHASSYLEDVILIAPKIEIQTGFKGNLQAFASQNITIQQQTKLNYPSALMLFDNSQKTVKENQIRIEKNSEVKGAIGYFSNNTSYSYTTQILIDEKAVINGEVYCTKNIDLRGAIFGTVYTDSFITKQYGGTYINHIYNGTIIANQLAPQYAGLSFSNATKNVAKWVY